VFLPASVRVVPRKKVRADRLDATGQLARQFRLVLTDSTSEVFVSLNTSLNQRHWSIVAAWLAVVAVAIVIRMMFGTASLSMTETLGWLVVGSVPAVVVLSVFRGAPQTTAQMLYDTEHSARTERAAAPSAN
jgi:hypothetical protein